jgi:hypothetical protein
MARVGHARVRHRAECFADTRMATASRDLDEGAQPIRRSTLLVPARMREVVYE